MSGTLDYRQQLQIQLSCDSGVVTVNVGCLFGVAVYGARRQVYGEKVKKDRA